MEHFIVHKDYNWVQNLNCFTNDVDKIIRSSVNLLHKKYGCMTHQQFSVQYIFHLIMDINFEDSC